MNLQNKAQELSDKKSNIIKSNRILTDQIAEVSEKCDVCQSEYNKTLIKRNLVKRQQTETLLVEQKRYEDLSKEVALMTHFPCTLHYRLFNPQLQKLHQSQSVQEKAIELQEKVNKVAELEVRVRQSRELNVQLEADIGQKKQLVQKRDAQLELEQVG